MYKEIKSLSIPLLLFCSTTVFAASFPTNQVDSNSESDSNIFLARDDSVTIVQNKTSTVSGFALYNDKLGSDTTAELISSPVGDYGYIEFSSDGNFIYTLNEKADNVLNLKEGDVVTDVFTYAYLSDSGESASANIKITIIGNPDDSNADNSLSAFDYHVTVVPNKIPTASGSLVTDVKSGSFVVLTSSPVSDYGYVLLNSDGSFVYTLYENAPSVTDLKVGDVITDEFSYNYNSETGDSVSAKLNVQIIGNPVDADGNTVFQAPVDKPYDNVDIEFNDRSAQATPLNSGRNIKGHLHDSGDKDWYKLASAGNEIISLEVCPQGSSCFGKKSWVLYVFDSDKLTQEMEEREYTFKRWIDDTGTTRDEKGDEIISGTNGSSNHMYLAYRAGFFDQALIGVVDPCFDTSNTVDIGVGEGSRNYQVAISSPLKGDSGDAESCGGGSVVLEEPGLNAIGNAPDGKNEDGSDKFASKKYTTTRQYISVFPKSDDQYTIKITGTGLHPLLSEEAKAKSATYRFDSGELVLPKVRVFNELYSANLSQEKSLARSANKSGSMKFGLLNLDSLGVDEANDAFQATYNPDNQQVIIPRVTDLTDDKAYSVILKYNPATTSNSQSLELINYELIE